MMSELYTDTPIDAGRERSVFAQAHMHVGAREAQAPTGDGFELRPYQSSAVGLLRTELKAGRKRLVLNSPTGSGKTEMGMEVIRGAVRKGKKVTFLCNRIHLVEQTSRRLKKAGIEHGIIQGENSMRTYLPVIVASIQTVARRGLPPTDLMVVDECHFAAGSKEFRKLLASVKDIPVIGLSATPWAKGMAKAHQEIGGPLFEEMVTAATIPDLIEQGYLVDADVYAPGEPDLSKVKTVAGDYNEKELGVAVDKDELIGDIVSHWFRLAEGLPTVVFATNIAHSEHICARFKAAGVTAAHIDCYTKDKDRIEILRSVERGEIKVLSNVAVLSEGWDFPACRVMILARPTKSMIRYIQMAGRVLRPFHGKDKALILDHSGTCKRLGFPTDQIDLPLDDGKPRSSAQQPKPEALPKPCPSCSFMKAPKVHKCPACGFEPKVKSEIREASGELTLMKRGKYIKDGIERNLSERFGSKQEVWSMLNGHALGRGYSRGWMSHKYRTIFGVWPRGLHDISETPSADLLSWLKAEQIRWAYSKKSA